MIRIVTAAAAAALFVAPAFAQDVSAGGQSSDQTRMEDRSDIQQDQTAESPSGSTTSDSLSSQQQLDQSGQLGGARPADCLPNDPRPECGVTGRGMDEPSDQQLGQTPGSEPEIQSPDGAVTGDQPDETRDMERDNPTGGPSGSMDSPTEPSR